MTRALLCVVLLMSVAEAWVPHKMFAPTTPPDVLFKAAIVVPEKYRNMMEAPARAQEELKEHPDLTESELVEEKDDRFAGLGLLQGATAQRGTALMLSNIGKVERTLSKELAGHPEIKAEELRDLRQAEDLVHSAGELMPHHHVAKHTAFLQQKTNAQGTSAASLAAEGRQELQKYGTQMNALAKSDRQNARKLGKARDTVEEALEAAGASEKLENQVDAWLSKAEKYGRRIVAHELSEAKESLKKARTGY